MDNAFTREEVIKVVKYLMVLDPSLAGEELLVEYANEAMDTIKNTGKLYDMFETDKEIN